MSISQTQVKNFEISTHGSVEIIRHTPEARSELSWATENNTVCSTEATKSYLPTTSTFPLQSLPSEIRHEIYAHYFAALPPHHISCSAISKYREAQKQKQNSDLTSALNIELSSLPPFHILNSLHLSSPFFAHDIPIFIYYQQTTFSFSCPSALRYFSSPSPSSSVNVFSSKHVRKLLINYGGIGDQGPDWVYLMLKAFERLEEVVFVVDEGCRYCGLGSERLEHWWGCVRDAFREGYGGKMDGKMGGGVRLRLEVRRGKECEVVKEA